MRVPEIAPSERLVDDPVLLVAQLVRRVALVSGVERERPERLQTFVGRVARPRTGRSERDRAGASGRRSDTRKPLTSSTGHVTYQPTTPTGSPKLPTMSHTGAAVRIVALTGTPASLTKSRMPCLSADLARRDGRPYARGDERRLDQQRSVGAPLHQALEVRQLARLDQTARASPSRIRRLRSMADARCGTGGRRRTRPATERARSGRHSRRR